MSHLSSIKDVISCWPSRREMAADIGASKERVDKWAQTDSIPARYHGRVLRAAAARGYALTAQDLVRLHDVEHLGDAA